MPDTRILRPLCLNLQRQQYHRDSSTVHVAPMDSPCHLTDKASSTMIFKEKRIARKLRPDEHLCQQFTYIITKLKKSPITCIIHTSHSSKSHQMTGAQWLSGRRLDSRPKCSLASLCCVLEQDTLNLA